MPTRWPDARCAIWLGYLADSGDADMQALADRHYQQSDNMTDRFAALSALVNSFAPGREHALADFYERFEDDALVIDKWFSLQGMQRGEGPARGQAHH
jgi:aminopeptidase N